jgi:polyisoprenoid-binding protein YceI
MKTLLIATALLAAAPAFADGAKTPVEAYKLDGAHTASSFTVKHLLISTVRGEFTRTQGEVTIDPADVTRSTVAATIDAASVNTREEKRDGHLRSPEFFDAAKYPTISFKSTKVEKAGEGKLKVMGDLTMHGVTKPVVLDVTGPTAEVKDPTGLARRGLSATTTFNRKDFGVSYGPDAIVSDLVTVTIDAELVKDQPAKS